MTSKGCSVRLRALVVSADGREADLASIESVLRHFGVPHDTIVATETPLAVHPLFDQDCGHYQAIFLTTGGLTYFDAEQQSWVSALKVDDRTALADYQRRYGARLVLLQASPSPAWVEHGLTIEGVCDTRLEPLDASLTQAGEQVFWYLDRASTVPLRDASLYLGVARDDSTVPLLVTSAGHAVTSIRTFPDGREQLATTIANSPQLLHSMLLAHGIVHWAMRGLWLGAGSPNLNVQVDDVLIANAIWDESAASDATGMTYRATASDAEALVAWQRSRRHSGGVTDELRLELGFVGYGTEVAGADDGLTSALLRHQAEFAWFNHTWDHLTLDGMGYEDAVSEISRNDDFARKVGLTHYSPESLVQGGVSGLGNPAFLRAAKDCGLRVVVGDTSQPGWSDLAPNLAVPSGEENLFVVPRHPTNLFCNVSTPDQWVSEYNHYYGSAGIWSRGVRNLSYGELLDVESEVLLRYLLRVDNAPVMFHQANLRAYDDGHSLLGDLLDATLNKYASMIRLPVTCHPLHVTGRRMADRAQAQMAGIEASYSEDGRLTMMANADVVVTVTGIEADQEVEWYGAVPISHVRLRAGVVRSLMPAIAQPV